MPKGWGVYRHFTGATFQGIWDGNLQVMVGLENWLDDTYYQGQYKDSKKHGIGTYKWADGAIYEGEWENNQIKGHVILYLRREYFTSTMVEFTWVSLISAR